MKNFYFFYFTVNMVMSLSLIDDGDDLFNHMFYSGGLRTLGAIPHYLRPFDDMTYKSYYSN